MFEKIIRPIEAQVLYFRPATWNSLVTLSLGSGHKSVEETIEYLLKQNDFCCDHYESIRLLVALDEKELREARMATLADDITDLMD